MSLAFLADVHAHNYAFGNDSNASKGRYRNSRLALVTKTLASALKADASVFFILGDLFDVHTPGPQIIDEVGEVFYRAKDKQIFLLRGNHDCRTTSLGDNALAPLRFLPNVEIIEEPRVISALGVKVFAMPHPYSPRDTEPNGVADLSVGHFGLRYDDRMAYHGSIPEDEVLAWCQLHGIRAFLAGDWHHHRIGSNGRTIQVGTLCPKNFSDADLSVGKVVLYDPSTCRVRIREVPGPRFTFASSYEEGIEKASALLREGNSPFIGLPPAVPLPELAGAVFATHHRKVANTAATATLSTKASASLSPMEVLRKYLDKFHPTEAELLYAEIESACRSPKIDADS